MKNIKLTKKYTSNNKKTFKNIKYLNNKSRSNLLDKKNNLKKYKYSNKILVGGSDTSNRGVKILQNIPPLVNGKGSNGKITPFNRGNGKVSNGKKKQGKGSADFQNNDRHNSGIATLTDSRNQSNTTVNEKKINSIVSLTLTSMMNPENLNIIKSQLMQSLLNKNDNKHHSNSKDAVIASESDVKAAASESDVKTAVAANPTLLGRRGNNFEPSNSAKLNATKLRLSSNPLLSSNEDNSLKASPGAAVAANSAVASNSAIASKPAPATGPAGKSATSLSLTTGSAVSSLPLTTGFAVAPSTTSPVDVVPAATGASSQSGKASSPPSTIAPAVDVVPAGKSATSLSSTTGSAVSSLPLTTGFAVAPSTTSPAVVPRPRPRRSSRRYSDPDLSI